MARSFSISPCFALVILACGDSKPTEPVMPVIVMPVIDQEAERVKSELRGRSFRRFDPSRDASERKAVILDFFERGVQTISLWAQFARDDEALAEWEVTATDYRVEKSGSEYTLIPVEPASMRTLPSRCEECITVSGLSISVRNLFNGGNIQFKLNSGGNRLPSPFPVFEEWSTWSEDEYLE